MPRTPYRAEHGAIHNETCTGFVFIIDPPEFAQEVANALNLAAQVGDLNPDAGEIGPGMLAELVALARKV